MPFKSKYLPIDSITEDSKSYDEIESELTDEEREKAKINLFFTQTLVQDRDYEPEQINEFKILKELGTGGFSTVYLVSRKFMQNGGENSLSPNSLFRPSY